MLILCADLYRRSQQGPLVGRQPGPWAAACNTGLACRSHPASFRQWSASGQALQDAAGYGSRGADLGASGSACGGFQPHRAGLGHSLTDAGSTVVLKQHSGAHNNTRTRIEPFAIYPAWHRPWYAGTLQPRCIAVICHSHAEGRLQYAGCTQQCKPLFTSQLRLPCSTGRQRPVHSACTVHRQRWTRLRLGIVHC